MKLRIYRTLFCAAFMLSSPAFADTPPSQGPVASIKEQSLRKDIAFLASDELQGRAPSSPSEEKTLNYIASSLEKSGIKPAVKGSYFQKVPLVKSTVKRDESSLTIDEKGVKKALSFDKDTVFWTKRLDENVSFKDSPLVFVGYGVVAPEYGWNDYEGLDVKGKTVVMLINDPGFEAENSDLFKGKAMTYYGRWTYKFEEAARQGATAALIIHETEPASYPWEVVSNSWSGAQFDLQGDDTNARAALEGWVTPEIARDLFKASGLDFETLKKSAQKKGFKPVPMTGLTASATIKSKLDKLESSNVIGLLPGAKAPDEYVIYMAHWDHLGAGDEKPGEDHIFNGAVDNATGVAGILEIARAFSKTSPPDRSILFIAVTAEESGLLGSKYFAEHPIIPLKNVVGGINIDAMLPVGPTKDMIVVGYGASELEDILKKQAARYNKYLSPDPKPEAGFFYRSDHISLAKKGVPMLYADGGFEHVEKGKEYGNAFALEYTEKRYHKPKDEYDESWDLRGIVQDLDILYETGRAMSQENIWPNWYKGNEFRILRDTMQAKP